MVRLIRSVNQKTSMRQFNVDFMDWGTYCHAMLNRTNHTDTWNRLAQADCLIGGVDTSLSYLYVTLLKIIPLLII